ncbi:MAG: type II toxin-antitoxin system HigB family toxin [Candidatus Marinimicrobia bacterium]|nr:type II toxin-antitoxin system HigB family toxin [Candidatus Neomarinimicrobiota bacterium]
MRVISRKKLNDFGKDHEDCQSSLDNWYRIVKHSEYSSFNDLRKTFPSADKVGNLTVFNIGGNKARLITAIHYNTGCVYVRYVFTHTEYDKGNWKRDLK